MKRSRHSDAAMSKQCTARNDACPDTCRRDFSQLPAELWREHIMPNLEGCDVTRRMLWSTSRRLQRAGPISQSLKTRV